MKLPGMSAPEKVVDTAGHLDVKTMVTSGARALVVMGALTVSSAVVSALRSKGRRT